MFRLILSYVCLAFSFGAIGQVVDAGSISGIIISSITGKPIPFAVIKYSNSNGVLVDSLGQFVIKGLSPGEHKLTFEALGYPTSDTILNLEAKSLKEFVWTIPISCNGKYNQTTAQLSIQNGNPKLLVMGGIAPVVYKSDKMFSRKYGVSYVIFGCIALDYEECMKSYNQAIFDYLNLKYGVAWTKEIRKDVIGLNSK